MKLHLLVTSDMTPVPHDITVLQNWGVVFIRTDKDDRIAGEHLLIEAEEEAIKDWLKPFRGVWIGKDPPSFQQFEVMHIK